MTRPSGEEVTFRPSSLQNLVNFLPSGTGTRDNPAEPLPETNLKDVITDASGTRVVKTDKFGNLLEEVDPLGRKTTIGRDESGNHTKITEPNGRIMRMEYDERGNLTKQVDESTGAETSFTYDPKAFSTTKPIG